LPLDAKRLSSGFLTSVVSVNISSTMSLGIRLFGIIFLDTWFHSFLPEVAHPPIEVLGPPGRISASGQA
jgi:hypothetical protein